MKKILTTLLLAVLMLPSTASVTFYVFGYVTSSENNSPVYNHAVTIMTDSVNGFFYYNTVYTNIDGYYADTVTSTADSGHVFVQTFDCNNNLVQGQFYYTPLDLTFQQDFVICTVQCNAEFTHNPTADSLTVEFIDLSAGAMSKWTWDFGDGNTQTIMFPQSPNVSHTYLTPGTYTVCLTVQNSDSTCLDTQCHDVAVGFSQGCNAAFTWYADTAANNLGIQFIDQSQGNINMWYWYFGDGTSGYGQNPYHVYADTGVYNVCLTISAVDSTCFDTQCWQVPVLNGNNCSSSFDFTVNNLTASFSGYMNNGYPATYNWDFGDSQTAQGQNVTHTFPYPGNFAVALTTIDSTGCEFTSWKGVYVGDSMNVHQIYGQVFEGSFTMNSGMVMIFSVDSTGGYFPFTDSIAVDSSGIYYFSYVPDGEYYIWAVPFTTEYLPTYYGDVIFWEDATVVVLGEPANPYNINLIPAPGLDPGNGTINGHINTGSYKSGYAEKISMLIENEAGEVLSHEQVNQEGDFDFTSLAAGTYWLLAELPGCPSDKVKVEITAENPVADVTLTFVNGKILGIDNADPVLAGVTLYPNPASGEASLVISMKQSAEVTLGMMNLTGRNIFSRQVSLTKGENRLVIPLGDVPSGVYIVRIQSGDGTSISQKLIKTR